MTESRTDTIASRGAGSVATGHAAEIVARGRAVIRQERLALEQVEHRLDARFADAVSLIAGSRGRVIVAGVGKSGLIGRKIAATLTSTGTPAACMTILARSFSTARAEASTPEWV